MDPERDDSEQDLTTHDAERKAAVERALGGDERAIDSVLAELLPRIRTFVRIHMSPDLRARESSSDLVQSVCVDLLRREGFEYRSEAEFRAWLFKAAQNKVNEKQRFHGRERRDPKREELPDAAGGLGDLDELGALYGSIASPSQNLMAREAVARVEAAFDELPDHYREVICLARIVGLPHSEVAAHTGRTVGAVRQLLGRALVKLAEILEAMKTAGD